MVQVIVHFNPFYSGTVMIPGHFLHVWEEYGLDIRIPDTPTRMFRKVSHGSSLIVMSEEYLGNNVDNTNVST